MYGLLPLHGLETGLLGKKKMCKCGKKMSVIRVSGRFPLKKKTMSFCHPVVSPLLLFPDPFKLLCKKCSLIGVRACVLPRPRECLRGLRLGRPSGIGRGFCAPARQQTPRRSPPTPPASRSEIVHRNPLAVPPAPVIRCRCPLLCGGDSAEPLAVPLFSGPSTSVFSARCALVAAVTTDVVSRL